MSEDEKPLTETCQTPFAVHDELSGGIEWGIKTIGEALASLESSLADHRAYAVEEGDWSDDIESVCAMLITHVVAHEQHVEDDGSYSYEWEIEPTAEWSRIKNRLDECDDLAEELSVYKLNTPHTKDGEPIFIGMKIWMEDPDVSPFDPERFIEQEVCSIYGRTFDEYEGDYTVSCTDLECGNLETFSTRESIESAMSGK